jgi:uncharacterized membrane protein YjjP (DUF1212 family)
MQRLSELYRLSKNVCDECNPTDVLQQTKHLLSQSDQYSIFQKIFAAALACASFTVLFEGSVAEFGAAFIATFVATTLKKNVGYKEFQSPACDHCLFLFGYAVYGALCITGLSNRY